ncbi:MAG TPA: phosphoribosylformylglycinamidine synthase subunit PurL [Candidatus Paceibacterota bacterium]|nr:phosphoribosylformylglycinamidine synthase subunit PurL [Candidatus Paceibacterota bacterium]
MASRITIVPKIKDARAETKSKQFNALLKRGRVSKVSIFDSYTIDASLKEKDLLTIGSRLLANPNLETPYIDTIPLPEKFAYVIEIGFLPGVTDNVGNTARETIEDYMKQKFKEGEAVYSSQIFVLEGKLDKEDAQTIASSLYNPLIQRMSLFSFKEVKDTLPIVVPKVVLKEGNSVTEVNLNVTDGELVTIGKQGIKDKDGSTRGPLALDLDYMKAIQSYFKSKGRNPTDIELESIAQTWSEHCKHTIFANPIDEVSKGLYKSYIKEATNIIRRKKGKKDICVSVFSDNAGAIAFDDKYLVTHKVETHNTPSVLDPFGGAITGIVGVNRDTIGFGMGAKPIANVYGFCVARPDDKQNLFRDKKLKQPVLSARRIMDGVIAGVNSGGNCSGIPTPHGFINFHERFRGKPLVFAGTIGLIPRIVGGKDSTQKCAKPGDYVVMLGGRVGQDGIHGATFSSEEMNEGSPATAVQIGDPITQKKFSDALIKEVRDKGLYTSITDDGAGGLSCSVAEMAKECGGCSVELEKVPLKYPGLSPWQTWISESQERMTLAVPPSKWDEFKRLMDERGVEATVIGTFTKNGKCVVTFKGKKIVDLDLEFLHNGLPSKNLATSMTALKNLEAPVQTANLSKILLDMIRRPNLSSFEFISRQYDHEVQANSVLKPLQGKGLVNSNAAVIRPVFESKKGVVMSSALYPTYTEIDSYKMAAASIDSAIRSIIAMGADIEKTAILDNFCWCDSTKPERLGQLKAAVKSCFDTAVSFETPFISGKDSMFNDFKGFDEKGKETLISVPPTLLVSSIGIIDDVEKAVSIDFKFPGDLIYLLGDTKEEMAGSEYYAYLSEKKKKEYLGNIVPEVDALKNRKLYSAYNKCIQSELVASAISLEKGGLGVALLKSSMAGLLGADVSLEKISKQMDADRILFSESQGRILVSINPKKKAAFEKLLKGNSFAHIGKVTSKAQIKIKGVADIKVSDALKAYKSTFKDF